MMGLIFGETESILYAFTTDTTTISYLQRINAADGTVVWEYSMPISGGYSQNL